MVKKTRQEQGKEPILIIMGKTRTRIIISIIIIAKTKSQGTKISSYTK